MKILDDIYEEFKRLNYKWNGDENNPFIDCIGLQICDFYMINWELKFRGFDNNYKYVHPIRSKNGKILKFTLSGFLNYLRKY